MPSQKPRSSISGCWPWALGGRSRRGSPPLSLSVAGSTAGSTPDAQATVFAGSSQAGGKAPKAGFKDCWLGPAETIKPAGSVLPGGDAARGCKQRSRELVGDVPMIRVRFGR